MKKRIMVAALAVIGLALCSCGARPGPPGPVPPGHLVPSPGHLKHI